MKQKQLIIGNWKMNPRTVLEARKLSDAVKKEAGKLRNTDVAMCPPFVFIGDLAPRITGKCVLCAQNVSFEEEGAFTGEVSTAMLKSLKPT